MAQEATTPTGPDLTQGIATTDLIDGKLVGHVGDQDVLVVLHHGEAFAVDARCTHYQGPLVDGLIVGGVVRCPWHHAAFDLRTGKAVRAPALSPLGCWAVEKRDDRIFVTEKRKGPKSPGKPSKNQPERVVIIGGGAAGFAAAEMLRRRNYQGSIVMLSNDTAPPIDRPNLSKDYLAGSAHEDWLPLRPDSFYTDAGIELRLGVDVVDLDTKRGEVVLSGGARVPYNRLLLATGAEPVRLTIPGANAPQVHMLRSLGDCRAIIDAVKNAHRVLVIGASFIGLEVAAAFRVRGVEVHVVAPDRRPMEKILGPQIGDFVRRLHEDHGVVFHLEDTVISIDRQSATLKSGLVLNSDLIVVGIGVRPRLSLAERAGLSIDRGVLVNSYLETSVPGIYAAGDIARWPDPHTGGSIRVEHWVVAERQGQTAASNMLGEPEKFKAVPFFWSQHYDVPINYVGHAERWDDLAIDGYVQDKDCVVRFKRDGRVIAAASIFRDYESLKIELEMEQDAH